MTDDPKTSDGDGPVTVGFIRQIVKDALGELGTAADKDTETRQAGRRALNSRLDRDSDIEDKILKVVGQLKDQEDRQRREQDLTDQVKNLTEKVADKAPTERNWAGKFMNWGKD